MYKKWEERRSSKRVSHLCEVQCEGSATNRLSTRINDLSATGIFVDSMTCYPEGSTLRLKFKINSVEIDVTGEVRYSIPNVGMGIRFVDLAPEHKTAIESVVGKE